MSLTIPDDQMSKINELVKEDRLEDALKALSAYAETQPANKALVIKLAFFAAHFDAEDISRRFADMLAKTLDDLPARLSADAQPHLDDINTQILQMTNRMSDKVEEEPVPMIEHSEKVLPLARHWPRIYLTHGQALLYAMTRQRRSLFSNNGPAVRTSTERLTAARKSLQAAIRTSNTGDSVYQAAIEAIIEVNQRLNDHAEALRWCEKGDEIVPDMLERWDKVGGQALQVLLATVDSDLRREAPKRWLDLVADVKGIQILPEVCARYADMALLDGALDDAERLYRLALDDDRTYRTHADHKRRILRALRRAIKRLTKAGAFRNRFGQSGIRQQLSELVKALTDDDAPTTDTASALPIDRYGLARDNMRLYGGCGLVAVAEKRGDKDGMLRAIYALLEDRHAPAANNTVLLDQLDTLEAAVAQDTHQQNQADAQAAYQQGDIAAAYAGYLAVCGTPYAQADDFLWLAACMMLQRHSADDIAQMLQATPADAIAHLPKKTARQLVDYISAGGHWALTDRFLPSLDGAKAWANAYHARRDAFQREQVAQARADIAAGRLDRARVIAQRLLAINPQDASAGLLLGRVHVAERHWSQARTALLPLLHREDVRAEVERLLTEVDLAEGHLARAEDRLKDMADDLTAAGVRRRMANMPYIQVTQAAHRVAPDTLTRKEAAVYNACFAVRLAGVHVAAQLPSMQHQIAEFLIGLHQVDNYLAQPHFTWRYIGRDGQVTIALICRVEATTAQAAETTALTFWALIRRLLPYQNEQIYTYEPVIHPDELAYLIAPLAVKSAAQIVRAELGAEHDGMYRVQSFGVYNGNMNRLLRILADQPDGVMMETYFQPTDIYAWERNAIETLIARNGRAKPSAAREMPNHNVMLHLAESAANQAAAQVYQDFFGAIQSLPFVVQTRVCAPAYLDPALPDMIGLELFGPSAYRIENAYTEADVAAAERTMREISGERWAYTAAPAGLERWRYLLTPMETLTATRLPVPTVEGLPGVQNLSVRVSPIPERLPHDGATLGESIVAVNGRPAEIRLSTADRMRHAYVVGRTGTGKSTLLENMALQDIEAGLGVGIIDPHGDLVENLLARIPAHRRHDVILFDPGDVARPIGLNILDVKTTHAQNVVISDFIGLLYSLFDPNRIGMIGPRFENAVRNSMLLAMDIPGSTFIEVVRIMTDKGFREKCLELATDPIVKSYWEDVASNISRMGDGDMLDYVTSKFGRFINDRMMRNIIGQSQNALDLPAIMNEGKILLVNLAKGKMGSEASHFLGLLLMPQIFVAALSRANLPADERRMFCLYVDEFHNFTTPTFSTMLAESRKYGVALTVANQFISQLTPSIREAVFGNIGTLLSFRVGINDARFLAQEFYPVYDERDLINLPNYYMLSKMLISGDAVPPFPVRTLPDNRLEDRDAGERIRENTRRQFGRDERVVNMEIRQRYKHPPRRR